MEQASGKDEPPDIEVWWKRFVLFVIVVCAVLIILIAFQLMFWGISRAFKIDIPDKFQPFSNVLIQNNSLIAISTHRFPAVRTYGSVIGCMERWESGGDPDALNPNDPITRSVGILQFKDGTFQEFCVERYKIASNVDEIWNEEIQRDCAELMLRDRLGYHWSTFKYCK